MLDPLINWNIQIQHLKKKLRTYFAVIKRISPFVPAINHKSLYHTLFESHLSYCISAWGMASNRYINEIFTIQKTAIRYLFGDYDSFLDKFCTAARTRPYDEQQLGISFYQKEHKKPLFSKHKILTVYNLCKYMAVNQIGKIITTKSPTALYDSIKLSPCNVENLILKSSSQKESCFHTVSTYWNSLIKRLSIPNPNIIPMLNTRRPIINAHGTCVERIYFMKLSNSALLQCATLCLRVFTK